MKTNCWMTSLIVAVGLMVSATASSKPLVREVRLSGKLGFKSYDAYKERLKSQIRQNVITQPNGRQDFRQVMKSERYVSRIDLVTGKPVMATRTSYVDKPAAGGNWNPSYPQDSTYHKAYQEVKQEIKNNNYWHR